MTCNMLTPEQEQKAEPITGISSEGYSGPGYIQSPARGLKFDEDE